MKTALRLLCYLRPHIGWVFLSILLGVATILGNIGLLGTSAYLISRAALHPSIAELQVAIVGVRFFGIFRSVLRYLERLASHSVNFHVLAEMRVWFFRALEPLAPAVLVDRRSGDLLNTTIGDLDQLEDFFVRAVAPPLTALVVTLGMGIFVGAHYRLLGEILVGGLALAGIGVPWLAQKISRRPNQELVSQRSQFNAEWVEAVQAMAEIISYGQDKSAVDKLRIANKSLAENQIKLAAWGGMANAANGLIGRLTLIFILLAALPLLESGGMDGIGLAVVAVITLASFEAANPLGQAAYKLEAALQSGKRIFNIADSSPNVIEPVFPQPLPVHRDLVIEGLTFSYLPDHPPALADVSFNLLEGKKIGVIGSSGSGKSTLVNILLRLWEYSEGQILLGGTELRQISGGAVRSCFTVLTQNPFIFNGTLRDNFLLIQPEVDDAHLWEVLGQAGLESWARSLPAGLDTWIGERGVQMSGGERQRLAVARAALFDSPIWLLDEPTEHLDPLNRQIVADEIKRMTRHRSVLWISHDFNELNEMDEIIVMQSGRIVERGTPEELEKNPGWYARWKDQRSFSR